MGPAGLPLHDNATGAQRTADADRGAHERN